VGLTAANPYRDRALRAEALRTRDGVGGAGESILPVNPLMHLFNVLKGKFTGKELNLFRN
jgi:hypothetical protein